MKNASNTLGIRVAERAAQTVIIGVELHLGCVLIYYVTFPNPFFLENLNVCVHVDVWYFAVLHNPDTSAYRSFQISRSKFSRTVALATYSSQSVNICALVTDRRHKFETCSTVTPPKENTEHSTGLHSALEFRSLISSQCECKFWHIPACQCAFFPLYCHGDNNSGQFYPQFAVTFYHFFGDSSLSVWHISQVRQFDKPPWL